MKSRNTLDKKKFNIPKGTWFQPKILASGEEVRYGYFGRGLGTIPLGRAGSPEFFCKLAEVAKKEPPQRAFSHAIWQYRKDVLPGLRERTRADYTKRLDEIQERFGTLSLAAMSSDHIGPHIIAWRDEVKNSPRQADYRIQVLSALMAWAAKPEQGLLRSNRASGISRLYKGDRRERTWTFEDEEAFLKKASGPMRFALILAVESGQREGDLLRLLWTNIGPNIIELRQSKTGMPAAVPISPRLRACLDEFPKNNSTTVLTNERGLPWDPKGNGFRAAWREVCTKAGIKGLTFHDLRGTFATRRLAEGWMVEDVAYCTGHSLRDLASLEGYVNRKIVARQRAEATANRLSKTNS